MADAYIVRPIGNIPDVLKHPLTQIKKVIPVKCPLCDYKIYIYYINYSDHFEKEDISHYEMELKIEHERINGHA